MPFTETGKTRGETDCVRKNPLGTDVKDVGQTFR